VLNYEKFTLDPSRFNVINFKFLLYVLCVILFMNAVSFHILPSKYLLFEGKPGTIMWDMCCREYVTSCRIVFHKDYDKLQKDLDESRKKEIQIGY
jgi:hypothetical protein